jgi:hypothetical protein
MDNERMKIDMHIVNNWNSTEFQLVLKKNENRRNKPFIAIARYYFIENLTVSNITEITNYSDAYVRKIIRDVECIVYNKYFC